MQRRTARAGVVRNARIAPILPGVTMTRCATSSPIIVSGAPRLEYQVRRMWVREDVELRRRRDVAETNRSL